MTLLPDAPDEGRYWRAVYSLPVSDWEAALAQIAARHRLPGGAWTRFALGRNVVFGCGDLVVKLSPPFWAADVPAEAAALRFVAGRLPVATATLLAEGALDGWGYVVQTQLPGALPRDVWPDMGAAAQEQVARQHGALMAALHALPVHDAPPALRRDWALIIGGQWERCIESLRESGVPEPLLADAPAYLEAVRAPLLASEPSVLHGDLNFLNLIATREPRASQAAGASAGCSTGATWRSALRRTSSSRRACICTAATRRCCGAGTTATASATGAAWARFSTRRRRA